jgi:hypothetical protein
LTYSRAHSPGTTLPFHQHRAPQDGRNSRTRVHPDQQADAGTDGQMWHRFGLLVCCKLTPPTSPRQRESELKAHSYHPQRHSNGKHTTHVWSPPVLTASTDQGGGAGASAIGLFTVLSKLWGWVGLDVAQPLSSSTPAICRVSLPPIGRVPHLPTYLSILLRPVPPSPLFQNFRHLANSVTNEVGATELAAAFKLFDTTDRGEFRRRWPAHRSRITVLYIRHGVRVERWFPPS